MSASSKPRRAARTARRFTERALARHEFYCYSDGLLFMERTAAQTDVLRALPRQNTFIVDNNVPWRRLATEQPDRHFILGCTVSEETDNLAGMLFNGCPPAGYPNVLLLDHVPQRPVPVVFHRLDAHCRDAWLSRDIPTLGNDSPLHAEAAQGAAESFRLDVTTHMGKDPACLSREINGKRGYCRGHRARSMEVAAMATALYFHELPRGQRERKLRRDYVNLPGDSRLIAEALYLGFGVLSTDVRDVHRLGLITGVRVEAPAV